MHLQVIIAFALLLWWPQDGPYYLLYAQQGPVLLFVWGKLLGYAFVAQVACWTALRLPREHLQRPHVQVRYHRIALALRILVLGGLGADLFLTNWPNMLSATPGLRVLPGAPQLIALMPYLLGVLVTWWMLYPVEQASRESFAQPHAWTRTRYTIFNLRHHILIVAVPLAVILVAFAAARDHRAWLVEHLGVVWAPDALVGAAALVVFVFSPLMLRCIWSTSPLGSGPLRTRLVEICRRIELKMRDILVWHSDGVMVNAAVMGLVPRLRYIMLSDALLDSMTDKEVEAVFGHEAGHVRHHHIQFFLLFALVSMLVVAGIMEFLTEMSRRGWNLDEATIQWVGIGAALPIWGIAFGWMSRNFERQADVFGATCASPGPGEPGCELPCAVHGGPNPAPIGSVCTGGGRVFVGALRKVALLNGIPIEERSWRHSSIASRIRFLTALTGDPIMARGFARRIRWIKLALICACACGLAMGAWYIWQHPVYRRQFLGGA